jgi:cytochrome P450
MTAAALATRRLDELPGPRGWPVLAGFMRPATLHTQMERWAERYGPAFGVRLGATRMLVLADADAVHEVLRDRPDGFQRSSLLRKVALELGSRPGLFSAEGDAWRRQRRMVMAAFTPTHIRAYYPSLRHVALRLRERWRNAARAGSSIDLQGDLKRFTVDAIAGLAFGIEVDTLSSDAEDRIQRHLDVVLAGLYRRATAPLPTWRWLRLPADRRLERSSAAVREAIDGFVAQARQRLAADPARREAPRNLLEAMLVAAADDGGLDDADVAGNVSTMLFAGEDTTANTLAWLIRLLNEQPDALRRARDEVRRTVPDVATATLDDLQSLEWLDACASEAMRLKPVAPFLSAEALRDTRVAGVAVPAGTLVWCVLRHTGAPETPPTFEPQRWLPGGALADGAQRRLVQPFGAGPRVCPGRYLALAEIRLAMAMLLGTFEIDAVDSADGGLVRETMAFTMNPSPLRLRLREFR